MTGDAKKNIPLYEKKAKKGSAYGACKSVGGLVVIIEHADASIAIS